MSRNTISEFVDSPNSNGKTTCSIQLGRGEVSSKEHTRLRLDDQRVNSMPAQVNIEVSRKSLDNNKIEELVANVEGAMVILPDREQVSNADAETDHQILRSSSQNVDGKDPTIVYDQVGSAIIPRESTTIDTLLMAIASATGSPVHIQINIPLQSPA